MFSSYSANEENKTFDELPSEECYEVISVPIWNFLWSLIIFLHFVVLGNIIYNVREGLGEGFMTLTLTDDKILFLEIYNGVLERPG